MVIRPFRALRSTPDSAATVASVPYDVVDTSEARRLAEGNPTSFLHVVRSEIDLPKGTAPYSNAVYDKDGQNLHTLISSGQMVREDEPSLYAYRMTVDGQVQVGLLAACSIDEYESGLIKKHELTRRDKEDDRTRHMLALGAQPGPVLVAYKDTPVVDELLAGVVEAPPLLVCESEAGVRHEVWRIADVDAVVAVFAEVPCSYIADGHHRSASAARARQQLRSGNAGHTGNEGYNFFLSALFPASQMKILAYNRVVTNLNGHSAEDVLKLASERFEVADAASPVPGEARRFCIYLAGKWHELAAKQQFVDENDPVKSLDCSILHEHFMEPILGIADIRTDPRIKFVGGIRGTDALAAEVDKAGTGVAFSMYPTSIEQLMAIADAGEIMPPKSTWFEPKLRSGLVVHLI